MSWISSRCNGALFKLGRFLGTRARRESARGQLATVHTKSRYPSTVPFKCSIPCVDQIVFTISRAGLKEEERTSNYLRQYLSRLSEFHKCFSVFLLPLEYFNTLPVVSGPGAAFQCWNSICGSSVHTRPYVKKRGTNILTSFSNGTIRCSFLSRGQIADRLSSILKSVQCCNAVGAWCTDAQSDGSAQ